MLINDEHAFSDGVLTGVLLASLALVMFRLMIDYL